MPVGPPRLRLYKTVEGERYPCVRESVSICFYMRHNHRDVAPVIAESLQVYRDAVGSEALAWYPDQEGNWQELDAQGWELNLKRLRHPRGATLCLRGTPEPMTGFEFVYLGRELDTPPYDDVPGAICAAAFWLPTEYLEDHGPAHVRALALKLGSSLPFNSGHAGLSFHFTEGVLGTTDPLRNLSFRHPGIDMPEFEGLDTELGTRIKGASWLTFLGSPSLDSLGGIEGLQARLLSEGTRVDRLEENRAVVTLGEWPQAGDVERGDTLPAYRELARVLEPWLYEARHSPWSGFTLEDVRRWERRLLDSTASPEDLHARSK